MTQLQLPERFLETMEEMLGEEFPSFLREFDGKKQLGLRVNTSMITLEEFERIAPFHLTRIPWIPDGYFYTEEDAPAKHPFYAAGLYYLQEPSAMTPASRLPVHPGERVLDLCAAPGGKATALGARLRGEGLLVANDINTARARALLRNLELFGLSNIFVTNEPPHVLAEQYPAYFDKIMVDAPCSGEGMFRKNPAVIEAWQEKGPEYFSRLQKEIILHGADMLRPGGMMFYSTCTFSPLENEAVITHLLRERPEMEVLPVEDYEGFAPGLTAFAGEQFHESCRLCRRIFPHRMPGEGHFLALLHKREADCPAEKPQSMGELSAKTKKGVRWWDVCRGIDKEQKKALADFFSHMRRELQPERIDVRGDKVYYVPEETQVGQKEKKGRRKQTDKPELRVHFLRNGLYLGDLKKKRFEPSQPMALALSGEDFDAWIDFPGDDPRLQQYLRGESFPVGDLAVESQPAEVNRSDVDAAGQPEDWRPGKGNHVVRRKGEGNGWYLVLVDGYPLGFGKMAGNVLKNKYPAGWRRNA